MPIDAAGALNAHVSLDAAGALNAHVSLDAAGALNAHVLLNATGALNAHVLLNATGALNAAGVSLARARVGTCLKEPDAGPVLLPNAERHGAGRYPTSRGHC